MIKGNENQNVTDKFEKMILPALFLPIMIDFKSCGFVGKNNREKYKVTFAQNYSIRILHMSKMQSIKPINRRYLPVFNVHPSLH